MQKPVFVDPDGRRGRWLMATGILMMALCLIYAALVLVSLAAEPIQPVPRGVGVAEQPAGDGAMPAPPAGAAGA